MVFHARYASVNVWIFHPALTKLTKYKHVYVTFFHWNEAKPLYLNCDKICQIRYY